MKQAHVSRTTLVLHEEVVAQEGAIALERARRTDTLAALLEAGHEVSRLRDGSAEPALSPSDRRFASAPDAGRLALAECEAADLAERARALYTEAPPAADDRWTPWFPVIDYKRCTNCMQCLSFCLFDVYGVDAQGQIEVRNEEKCKTNCPACSRVCPDVAILFPKYGKGPINGDAVKNADVQKEAMKVDITALLGGDIYSSLRERSTAARKRFSTERDESKALLERKRCLKELGMDLDIPDEVLMSLPSAGEIEERAARAKEKMERRRAISRTVQDTRPAPSEEEWDI